MKNAKRGNLFLFFALAILISTPLVFAGFAEWWAKVTGKATSQTTAVSITVGNTAPNIYFVNVTSHANGSSPSEGIMLPITVQFNVTDADGIGTLVNSTARATINLSGDFYYNQTCPFLWGNSTDASYNCTINLPYYAVPGTYNVNGSIADINGARGTMWGQWILGTLKAITISPTSLDWAGVSTASTNVSADNDPIAVNNTGNDNALSINVTAYDVGGFVNTGNFIYASNFSAHNDSSTACDTASWARILSNATSLGLYNTTLNRGYNATTGLEDLYFCLRAINSSLPADTYNRSYGGWQILVP